MVKMENTIKEQIVEELDKIGKIKEKFKHNDEKNNNESSPIDKKEVKFGYDFYQKSRDKYNKIYEQLKVKINEETRKRMRKITSLGIESSANKLGISIFCYEKGGIISNRRRTYNSEIRGEGFKPRDIFFHHKKELLPLLSEVLSEASINSLNDIDIISYTSGPGIGSTLHLACLFSKIFALTCRSKGIKENNTTIDDVDQKFNESDKKKNFMGNAYQTIPLVGVNHCIAHIEMGRYITDLVNPSILYVSGGNTQVIIYNKKHCNYRVCGETIDSAIGNVFDKIARLLYLSNSPAPGRQIEIFAAKHSEKISLNKEIEVQDVGKEDETQGTMERISHEDKTKVNNKNSCSPNNCHKEINVKRKFPIDKVGIDLDSLLLPLPYVVKGMDVSFSGIHTYVELYLKNKNISFKNFYDPSSAVMDKKKREELEEIRNLICYSVQEVCFSTLIEVTERALSLNSVVFDDTKGVESMDTNKNDEVLIVGGVGCNERLQEMAGIMCLERKIRETKMGSMNEIFCIDNGAMIAYTGLLQYCFRFQFPLLFLLYKVKQILREEATNGQFFAEDLTICQGHFHGVHCPKDTNGTQKVVTCEKMCSMENLLKNDEYDSIVDYWLQTRKFGYEGQINCQNDSKTDYIRMFNDFNTMVNSNDFCFLEKHCIHPEHNEIHEFFNKQFQFDNAFVSQRFRTEDVFISWRF